MNDFNIAPEATEAQYICQVRGCRKLFVEAMQIEAHLKHHRNYIPTNGHFECKCCSESFTRKEQIDQHTLNSHTYDGILKNQENLNKAEIRHTVHGTHLEKSCISNNSPSNVSLCSTVCTTIYETHFDSVFAENRWSKYFNWVSMFYMFEEIYTSWNA